MTDMKIPEENGQSRVVAVTTLVNNESQQTTSEQAAAVEDTTNGHADNVAAAAANSKHDKELHRERNLKLFDEYSRRVNRLVDARFAQTNQILIRSQLNKFMRFKELIGASNVNQNNHNDKSKPVKKKRKKPPLSIESHKQNGDSETKKLRIDNDIKNGVTVQEKSECNQAPASSLEVDISIETIEESDATTNVILTLDLVANQEKRLLARDLDNYASLLKSVKEYEIYGGRKNAVDFELENMATWKLIGNVDPCVPPIKCTLTDFEKGCTYYFSVRIKYADDTFGRYSPPQEISL